MDGWEILTFGTISIDVPTSNPLPSTYRNHPEYSGPLSRIAACVAAYEPKSVILDIGANVGDTAAIIRSVAADATIYCFEGDQFVFDTLCKNKQAVNIKECYNVFLGEVSKPIKADLEKIGWNTTVIPNETSERTIDVITLDEAWKNNIGIKVDLIKIDAEGFDCRILRGSEDLLRASKPALFFEYNRDNMDVISEEGLSIFEYLNELGYKQAFIYEAAGRFMMSVETSNLDTLKDIHEYIGGGKSAIKYIDVCTIHSDDSDLISNFASGEQEYRSEGNKKQI